MGVKGIAWRIGAALATVAALVGCGGGDTVERFVPDRLVAFGDEMSVLQAAEDPAKTTEARKYTVNAVTEGAVDCRNHELWIQIVARAYGLAFAQCRANADAAVAAHTLAAPGAKVAELAAQVDGFVAGAVGGGAPKASDLVTMLVGTNDVVEIAETAGLSEAERRATARERGRQLALQVNRVAVLGPAVIVSTMPDVGLTPYAREQGRDAALLSRLSADFNTGLRITMIQDGKLVGIVFADALTHNAVRFPQLLGFSCASRDAQNNCSSPSVTAALCRPEHPLPGCDNVQAADGTRPQLVENVAPSTWLWADALRPGPTFHHHLGISTLSRAQNNPF